MVVDLKDYKVAPNKAEQTLDRAKMKGLLVTWMIMGIQQGGSERT